MRREQYPPRLVYDDECGFCTWAVEYALARGEFEPVGFSDLTPDQLARLPENYENCSHLLTDDAVYSCGAGAEEIVRRLESPTAMPARAFRRLPFRGVVRERLYHLIADNRALFGRLFCRRPPASE